MMRNSDKDILIAPGGGQPKSNVATNKGIWKNITFKNIANPLGSQGDVTEPEVKVHTWLRVTDGYGHACAVHSIFFVL